MKKQLVYGDSPASYYQDGVYYDGSGRPVDAKYVGMTTAEAVEAGYVPGRTRTADTEPKRVEANVLSADDVMEKYSIQELRKMVNIRYRDNPSLDKPNLRGTKEALARWLLENE